MPAPWPLAPAARKKQKAALPHGFTPVPELLYPEAAALKWLFRQEKATLHNVRKGYNDSGTGL